MTLFASLHVRRGASWLQTAHTAITLRVSVKSLIDSEKNDRVASASSAMEGESATARLRLVMEAANIGCWDWDIVTNSVYHSPEWKRQLGYEDHEVTNDIGEWQ